MIMFMYTYKLKFNHHTFCISKTSKNFETSYKAQISEIKLKNLIPNSNFVRHI